MAQEEQAMAQESAVEQEFVESSQQQMRVNNQQQQLLANYQQQQQMFANQQQQQQMNGIDPHSHVNRTNHLSQQHVNVENVNEGFRNRQHTRENFQNLARNPTRNAPSQQFAQHQQNFRQQGAINNGFIRNDFRRSGGN